MYIERGFDQVLNIQSRFKTLDRGPMRSQFEVSLTEARAVKENLEERGRD